MKLCISYVEFHLVATSHGIKLGTTLCVAQAQFHPDNAMVDEEKMEQLAACRMAG